MCDEKLGDKIYDLRMSKKLSQEYIARVAGVTRQTVSKWEANAAQPKSENLRLLCKALNVDMSYLMPINYSDTNDTDTNESYESEAVCDEVTAEESNEVKIENVDDGSIEERSNKTKRNLSQKSKIIIASVTIAVSVLVGIAMIIFSYFKDLENNKDNFAPKEVSTIWNFNIGNIGWIIFGITISMAVLMGIILVCKSIIKKKNENKEMALSHMD